MKSTCCCQRSTDFEREDTWNYVKYSYAILCGCPTNIPPEDFADHHDADRSLDEGQEDEPGDDRFDCETSDDDEDSGGGAEDGVAP